MKKSHPNRQTFAFEKLVKGRKQYFTIIRYSSLELKIFLKLNLFHNF